MRVRPAYRLSKDDVVLRFNPRTRESATNRILLVLPAQRVSIHALVRVRPGRADSLRGSGSFNPRTRESATA